MTTTDEPNDNKGGGDQTNINSGGGDVAGRDIDKRQAKLFVANSTILWECRQRAGSPSSTTGSPPPAPRSRHRLRRP
jgi:hypothetical protein